MPQHLIDLARRFDERVRLANEANYDESKHLRAEDGKWTSGGGSGGATVKKVDPKTTPGYKQEKAMDRKLDAMVANNRYLKLARLNGARLEALVKGDRAGVAKAHMDALKAGFVWDKAHKEYKLPRKA